jgi:DNA-binding CsgD family transcriptional regulator
MPKNLFTPEECDLIVKDYAAYVPVSETADKLGRSEGSVGKKIQMLGLRRPALGTRLAPEHLKALAGKIPPEEWRAKYHSWKREQLNQARASGAQAKTQAAKQTALRSAAIDAREDLTHNQKIAAKYAAGMTLSAIGMQHGITRERVRQIVNKIRQPHRTARRQNRIRAGKDQLPYNRRLEAIMDVLGYNYHGGQGDFAKAIGVRQNKFSNMVRGHPLSLQVGLAIFDKFPQVSLEFLWRGLPGHGNARFEQQLREWERKNGRKIFVPILGALG